ncbi:MAG: FtsW/RodA/SpoVE family cell cycle protein [Ilumatobacteraceae bacterium]
MALALLRRKPDRGLGNIHASASAPSRNIDWVLMTAVAMLSVIGLFIIYSASYSKAPIGGAPYGFFFVTRQQVFLIVAVIVMAVVMYFDYDWWRDRANFFYGVTVVSLVLILMLNLLNVGDGSTVLSFSIGPINVQPAEVAKFTVLLALVGFISDERSEHLDYHRFVIGLVLVGVPVLLIIMQPDLGSATVPLAMMVGVTWVAGAKLRYLLMIFGLSAATIGAALLSGFVNDYQLNRFAVFFDQDSNDQRLRDVAYQGRNAIRALATGGVTGRGWLEGPITNASKDIPVQWADFPFSAVGEQFGMVGGLVVIALFSVVLARIWRIAQLSKDTTGTLICAGVFSMTLWQAFQNIAMTVGVMPITGLPLPFISYGGSGIVTYFALMGLVQNVHMRRYR